MKNAVSFIRRFAVTALAVVAALAVGRYLWVYYMDAPWTRDGRVRADVVTVAPDVSGFVTEILVRTIRRWPRRCHHADRPRTFRAGAAAG
jgi:multidrug resistance efflux pump